jgi:hypothetical protein
MLTKTHSEYDQLNKAAITDQGDGDWVMYKPVHPYQDAHGTVVAQLIYFDKSENELDISSYYSRAWCYWNYIDHTVESDFEDANWFIAYETEYIHPDGVNYFIDLNTEAINFIEAGQIPHNNPAWQQAVVALAYNAITDTAAFEHLIENSPVTLDQVQKMLDLAAGAVLQHPNFQLTGFQHISPK